MSEALGKYRLIAELGRGGMGTVYLAVIRGPARFNKLVVIKQLRTDVADDASFTTMFLEEARLAARLNHPNVVQTNEVVCDPHDGYFIVMEYVEGPSLKTFLKRVRARAQGPEDRVRARGLFIRALIEILSALQYAHDLKDFDGEPLHIVHRDVSPANVVVAQGGQVKLLDFGIAKAADSVVRTQAGVLKGKIHYMAPEALSGDPIDRRVDVFSVGAMLWDALAGHRLWDGLKEFEIVNALLRDAAPSPRTVDPDVPLELEAVCMRAIAFKAAERYPDAATLREELERAAQGQIASADELSNALNAEFSEDQQVMRARIADQLQAADELSASMIPKLGARSPSSSVPGVPGIAGGFPTSVSTSAPHIARNLADTTVDRVSVVPARVRTIPLAWRAGAGVGLLGIVVAAFAARSCHPAPPAVTVQFPAASSLATSQPPAQTATDNVEPAPSAQDPTIAPPAESHETDHSSRAGLRHKPKKGGRRNAKVDAVEAPSSPAELTDNEAPPSPAERASPDPPSPPATSPPTPSASPVVAAPEVPKGTIPKAAQNAVFAVHHSEIQACWERARMDQPYLNVRISIEAAIAPDGHVTDVNLAADRDGTARLQSCIHDAVQSWTFPRPAGDAPGRITNTLRFD
jgi:serine/threonine-protein kinase